MSAAGAQPQREPERPRPDRTRFRRLHRLVGVSVIVVAAAAVVGAAAWGAMRAYRSLGQTAAGLPLARVRRGDVTFTVTARGKLQGGSPENIPAPMIAGSELRITFLRKPGELVKAGDIVLQFDTTEQDFKLKEAEADLAEMDQQVLKAKAESEAAAEENRYALVKAKSDVRQAELEMRRNRLLPAISARQNELALETARERFADLERDLANRSASGQAAIEIQEAARKKAESQADTARRNIEQMTVRAKSDGYFSVRQNTSVGMIYEGMALPLFRTGDRVYAGMVVAEIPDLKHWELTASIGELDRGHLAAGQKVEVRVVALPFREFTGRLKEIGGTQGPVWDRRFECTMTVDDPSPELRPGMNADVVVTTEVMRGVLWLPAQAVFETGGRKFVYVPSGEGFASRDVAIVRRSESQAVIDGLAEGQTVALASPEHQRQQTGGRAGAMEAIRK